VNVDLLLVTLARDDHLDVSYQPAETVRDALGTWERPEAMNVHLGRLNISGPPTVVIETLGRALTKCYAAWGDGDPDDDGPAGPVAALQSAVGPAPDKEQHTNEGGER
jgi:hypothetical protein